MIRWHERELLNLPRVVWTWKDGRSWRELSRAERREAEETDPSLHPILERWRRELQVARLVKRNNLSGSQGVRVLLSPRSRPRTRKELVFRPDLLKQNGKS